MKDISNDDKVSLYKSTILSDKQSENLDYALNHDITSKSNFSESYKELAKKDINLPSKDDYEMMNNANISLKDYTSYKVATKGLTKESEKNKAILNMKCSEKAKQAIYENTTGKDDATYSSIKNAISIDNYLKYKSQKFEADKDINGKSRENEKNKEIKIFKFKKNE